MNYFQGDPVWLNVLNGASAVVVAVAAGFAAYFAARGLSAWRSELLGRRRYELAEEVLLSVRELEGHIAIIRSPISTGSEQAEFEQGPNETAEDFRLRVTYSTASLRYQQRAEYFAKLRALAFRAGVLIDEVHEAPLQEALQVVDDVMRSAHMAHMFATQFNEQAKRHWAGLEPLPQGANWAAKMHEQEEIYWGTGGPDDRIALRVKTAVKQTQDLFKPILKGL